uniref:Uncharacterized protein n=1 Tax=Panstrongylus lignarius TaxID=156445 RepID=A0A224Y2E7_9HEMI
MMSKKTLFQSKLLLFLITICSYSRIMKLFLLTSSFLTGGFLQNFSTKFHQHSGLKHPHISFHSIVLSNVDILIKNSNILFCLNLTANFRFLIFLFFHSFVY